MTISARARRDAGGHIRRWFGNDIFQKMQSAFDYPFGDVRIDASDDAQYLLRDMRTCAATQDATIFLAQSLLCSNPFVAETVLAHELAHVVQKRRPGSSLSAYAASPEYECLLELEANRAAQRAVAGRPARCVLPDQPTRLAAWGPAGHYYTAYFVLLAASGNNEQAQRRAFFCQMPDQVFDFDAVSAACDYYQQDSPGKVWIPHFGTFVPISESVETETQTVYEYDGLAMSRTTVIVETAASRLRRKQIDRQISTGLHCLTGRKGTEEIAIREKLLYKYKDDDLRYGLALHCFGDSYAHQTKEGRMYTPIQGHALDGHAPDDVARHGTQYIHYVAQLHRVASKTMAIRSPRLDLVGTLDALEPVWKMQFDADDDVIQQIHCGKIRQIARKMNFGDLGGYSPEREKETYWRLFWRNNSAPIKAAGGADQVYNVTRSCGKEWGT